MMLTKHFRSELFDDSVYSDLVYKCNSTYRDLIKKGISHRCVYGVDINKANNAQVLQVPS